MFKDLLNSLKSDEVNTNIEEENRQLRRKNKYSKKEIDNINAEKNELAKKYIEILEEKSQKFNDYLKYQEMYGEAYATIKAQKKEIAELKEEIKELSEEIERLNGIIDKKNDTIKREKKKNEEILNQKNEEEKNES